MMAPEQAKIEQLTSDLEELQIAGGFSRWELTLENRLLTLDLSAQRLFGLPCNEARDSVSLDFLISQFAAGQRYHARSKFLNPTEASTIGDQDLRFWNPAENRWKAVRIIRRSNRGSGSTCQTISGFFQDVSEIHDAKERLDLGSRILETSEYIGKVGYWTLSWSTEIADGYYEFSPIIASAIGLASGITKISAKEFRERVHVDDMDRCDRQFLTAMRNHENAELEYRFWHIQENRWLTVRSLAYFVRDPVGRVIEIHGCTQDVTARKADELALLHDRVLLDSAEQLARLGSWTLNLQTDAMHISVHLANILGVLPERGLSGSFADLLVLIHPEDRGLMEAAREHSVRTREPLDVEYRHWNMRDSRWITVKSMGRVLCDDNDTPTEFHGVTGDITEQRESQERLRLAASVFEYSRSMILISDSSHRVVQANRAFTDLYGYPFSEIVGKNLNFREIVFPDDVHIDDIWSLVDASDLWQGEVVGHNQAGDEIPMMLNLLAVRNEAGYITHYISIADDITRQKTAEETNRRYAYYDTLTNLPNRILMRDRVEQAISIARRENSEVALLFLDLDNFKHINDSLGHVLGDKLLTSTSERILATIRNSDSVGRLGGDEFLILLPQAGPHSAKTVAEKIISAVNQAFLIDDYTLTLTTSIGISVYPHDADTFYDLMRMADTAMYRAKDTGRNAYVFFTQEMNHAAQQRLLLTNDLRKALLQKELTLHYQPQISLSNHHLIGFEALLRWNHPTRGQISPLEFIPLAEESGLIEAIGNWVMSEACSQTRDWIAAGFPLQSIAVNCSMRQLQSPELLLAGVKAALQASGLPPQVLELEITESVLATDVESKIALLDQIRAIGVRIAIDDFGTGYSSLSYLKRMPIDKLKIDRSFVSDIDVNENDRAIASTIIALGHALKLKIVAEGVETAEQLEVLDAMACDEAQGYFWARPMGEKECVAWMKDNYQI